MANGVSQGSFIINNPEESKTLSKLFIAEPGIAQEKKLGKIFSLIETPASNGFNQKIITLIIDEVKNNYYTLENLDKNKPLEDIFEDFLYKLNQKIHRFIQEEKNLFDLGKINTIIGTIKPEYENKKINFNIHFSQVGRVEMILIQKIGYKNYKITQINRTASSDIPKPNPFKFFSNIVSGKLAEGDHLTLCNYAILDYISLDKLKNSAVSLEPDKLIEHFKTILVEVDERIPFAFILFRLILDKNYFEESQSIKVESMPKVVSEKMVMPETQKIVKPQNAFSKQTAAVSDQVVLPKRSFWQNLRWRIKRLIKPIKATKKIITLEKQQRDKIVERWSEQKLKKIDSKITGFKKITFFRKTLLLIGIILIILFVGSIFLLTKKQQNNKSEESFNQLIKQIEEKKNLAESSLIYDDKSKAKQNIEEALKFLEKLPKTESSQQKKFDELAAEIKAIDQKTKNMVNIMESAPFIDLAKELKDSSINNIIGYNGKIYAWQAKDNKIYQVDLATKNISQINYPPINAKEFKNTATYDESAKTILFQHDDGKLTKLNLDKQTLTPQEIKLPPGAEISDLKIYNGKLYLVDNKNNQIYKYLITGDSFTNQTNWLKDKNINLSNTVSMAIDSNLYLLKSNGQILKFFTGKAQTFGIKNLEPAFSNPTKIYTSVDDKYIYVLEPAQKRLVILDKNGDFVIQYYSENFSNLKDLAVFEKNKKIYLLNDRQIYQINTDFIK